MILVFGAGGACGEVVTKALARRGADVRAFAHNQAGAEAARRAGAAETLVGDLRNPDAVGAALQGASGVFYLCPKFVSDEASLGRMVVALACRAGVHRFVYQSALHSGISSLLHHEFKRQVEEALFETDLEFTILQPARLMHNLLASWAGILASGLYVEPFSVEVPVSDVDFDDVAEVAALALTEAGYGRATFELCAEGMLNRWQRAELLSEVLDRPIRAGACGIDEFLTRTGITDPYGREARARMFRHYDAFGFRGGNSLVLRTILCRDPGTLRGFIQRTAVRLGATGPTGTPQRARPG